MKVLIAEDADTTRAILRQQFIEWGYEVIEAADGREAWEKFQHDPVFLVVSDWQMPGMSGLELLRRIRAVENGRYAYVILLTARRGSRDLVEGMEVGADDFVSKPFDQDELRTEVAACRRCVEYRKAPKQEVSRSRAGDQHEKETKKFCSFHGKFNART